MVGAAGFEPATWSTQNSRATRLRYTPPVAALDSCFPCAQQAEPPAAGLVAAKKRAGDAVARRDVVFARGAGDHFRDAAYRTRRWDEGIRQRRRVLRDVEHAPVAADENHIERDVGIAHPELHLLLGLKIEQHAVALRQRFTEHQAAGALRIVGRKLDGEGVHAGTGDDL